MIDLPPPPPPRTRDLSVLLAVVLLAVVADLSVDVIWSENSATALDALAAIGVAVATALSWSVHRGRSDRDT